LCIKLKKRTEKKHCMEKGDWVLIIIIIIILLAVALLISNMDKLFPTPTVQEAIRQTVNITNST